MLESLRMMVPEAWQNDPFVAPERRAFYDFHSTLMEPRDGPALVVATDGRYIGAVLDRNGFRPCRWCLTADGRFMLASESGVLDLDEPNPGQQIQRRVRQLAAEGIAFRNPAKT